MPRAPPPLRPPGPGGQRGRQISALPWPRPGSAARTHPGPASPAPGRLLRLDVRLLFRQIRRRRRRFGGAPGVKAARALPARQLARAAGRGGAARTVIINLQQRASEGKRTATGGSRLPFYVPVPSGSENGARGGAEPHTDTQRAGFARDCARPVSAPPGTRALLPAARSGPSTPATLWLRAHTCAHPHTYTVTRVHWDTCVHRHQELKSRDLG